MPESFKKSFAALMESGGFLLDLPEEMGGTTAPRELIWSLSELVLGANPAVHMYAGGPSFAATFWRLGTDEQKEWAKLIAEKQWGATMVLTEPDAGSDVGAGRTKALPQADGTWHIEGVKRFITSAEHDMTENIIHYVLARPVGVEGVGGPGTKGLSLFMVPKFLFDFETGELGERNGAFVTNVEHKMGLKASTTCELTFGEQAPAVGWLVGEVHDGIAQMFKIIEYARMMVGTKAIATLSTGYLNALDYAKSRVQGADLTRATDKTAPRVTITHHPDVRRSLMRQKSYAEGLRALVHYTASIQDQVIQATHAGDKDAADAAERLNDLLLPLVKGCGSERAYELLGGESLQTFGGSGFLQDYPLEQYIRDAKIDTLYEGTTAIQGQDLFFRKIVRDQGRSLAAVATEITAFIESEAGNGRLKEERALLKTGARGRPGDGRLDGRQPDVGAGRGPQRLQGRPQHDPPAAQPRRPRGRLAAAAAGRGGRRGARPWRRQGRGVLPGQAGRGAVLRDQRAARADRQPQDRRERHAGPDGPAGRGVLTQSAPRAVALIRTWIGATALVVSPRGRSRAASPDGKAFAFSRASGGAMIDGQPRGVGDTEHCSDLFPI